MEFEEYKNVDRLLRTTQKVFKCLKIYKKSQRKICSIINLNIKKYLDGEI